MAWMKILAVTDFSTEGDESIRQGDAWARAWNGELLVTCFDRHRDAAARLTATTARLTGRTPDRVRLMVEEGSPASHLPHLAGAVDAGLIVVPGGSRRWRSIARRVVHHAHASVLVARPPGEHGLVLFATDLSPSTPQPLWVASEEARRRGGKLVMLNVHDLGDAVEEWMGTGFGRLDGSQLGAGLHARLHQRLRAALSDALAASAVVGEPRVIDGEPAEGIVRAADKLHPALLVIGSTVWSPLRHLLGSVTEAVVRAAPCPVLVVRPGTQWSSLEPAPVGELR
jgi:nucleotide-binding universal stress UspA family protein